MHTSSDLPDYAVRSWGDGPGAALLCVHGMLGSARSWDVNGSELGGVARVVAVDLWGHGSSPSPRSDAHYTVPGMIEALERTRRQLVLERIVLCGHSFGAGLALRYALTYPERCEAVVFSNSRSALSPPGSLEPSGALELQARDILRDGPTAIRAMPMHPRHATRLPSAVHALAIEDADRVDSEAIARLIRVTAPQLSVLADIDRIRCPVLMVNGRYERRFQPLRDLACARIPDCRVVDLEAGHAVHMEDPSGFNAAVIDFMESRVGWSRGAPAN